MITPDPDPEPEEKANKLIFYVFENNKELEREIAKKIAELEKTALADSTEFLAIKEEFENLSGGFIAKNRRLKRIKQSLEFLKIYEKNVLFLENKDQYYTVKSSVSGALIDREIGAEVSRTFPDLSPYDIVFITNPQSDFTEEEIVRLERYMETGGVLILCGTYDTYLNTDLNRITEKHGTTFIRSSFRDDASNSGKSYYVRVTAFPDLTLYDGITELNISGGVLLSENCTVLLSRNDSSYAVTDGGIITNFALITLKKVGEGYLVCSGSSQMVTTGIRYGDNWIFTIKLIEYLLNLK
jgi:hypothetical protein